MLIFRKATRKDIDNIVKIYSEVHTLEEEGKIVVGWVRGIYPTRETAELSLKRGDLFVAEDDDVIVGTAIINRQQVDEYKNTSWQYEVSDDKIMVLHTLVISPKESGRGYGKAFVNFYEQYALSENSPYLRMDTNEKNIRARAMYKKLGYREVGIVPCNFNGINGIGLVLLEKKLD